MTRRVALLLAALLGLTGPCAWAGGGRGQPSLDVAVGLRWERRAEGLWVQGWLGGPGSPWRGRWDMRLERERVGLEGWLDDGQHPFRFRLEAGPGRP